MLSPADDTGEGTAEQTIFGKPSKSSLFYTFLRSAHESTVNVLNWIMVVASNVTSVLLLIWQHLKGITINLYIKCKFLRLK